MSPTKEIETIMEMVGAIQNELGQVIELSEKQEVKLLQTLEFICNSCEKEIERLSQDPPRV